MILSSSLSLYSRTNKYRCTFVLNSRDRSSDAAIEMNLRPAPFLPTKIAIIECFGTSSSCSMMISPFCGE